MCRQASTFLPTHIKITLSHQTSSAQHQSLTQVTIQTRLNIQNDVQRTALMESVSLSLRLDSALPEL
jgi:hypothetical protein